LKTVETSPKKAPKWALCMTWRRRYDFVTKMDANAALKAWKEAKEAAGWTVKGSMSTQYFAHLPDATFHDAAVAVLRGEPPVGVATAFIRSCSEADDAPNPWNGPDATDG
jgi:hypothetical protein